MISKTFSLIAALTVSVASIVLWALVLIELNFNIGIDTCIILGALTVYPICISWYMYAKIKPNYSTMEDILDDFL